MEDEFRNLSLRTEAALWSGGLAGSLYSRWFKPPRISLVPFCRASVTSLSPLSQCDCDFGAIWIKLIWFDLQWDVCTEPKGYWKTTPTQPQSAHPAARRPEIQSVKPQNRLWGSWTHLHHEELFSHPITGDYLSIIMSMFFLFCVHVAFAETSAPNICSGDCV